MCVWGWGSIGLGSSGWHRTPVAALEPPSYCGHSPVLSQPALKVTPHAELFRAPLLPAPQLMHSTHTSPQCLRGLLHIFCPVIIIFTLSHPAMARQNGHSHTNSSPCSGSSQTPVSSQGSSHNHHLCSRPERIKSDTKLRSRGWAATRSHHCTLSSPHCPHHLPHSSGSCILVSPGLARPQRTSLHPPDP